MLRARMRASRSSMAPEMACRLGSRVVTRLSELGEVVRAPRVALYAALPDEIATRDLHAILRERGTPTLLPRCEADGRLAFAVVERWEDLRPGRYGVAEPSGPAAALGPDDVVIVPGLAFDARGFRLGRGGGYYDRTFPPGAGAAPFLVGAGYAFQRVDAVPNGPHDRRLDAVVNERETLRAGEGEQP